MKNKLVLCGLTALVLAIAACSSAPPAKPSNANTSTVTVTPAPAQTPASTTSSPASTSAAQDFTLINETGVEIDKLFISPHDQNDWEEDILGRDTLPSGQSVDIKFHRAETAPVWDLRIEDTKGNGIEWQNLNLLEISKVTLYYNDGKGTAKIE